MARDLEHLKLSRAEQEFPIRPPGGGKRESPKPDKPIHGQALIQQAERVSSALQEQVRNTPAGENPKLVFKLRFYSRTNLDDDKIRNLGLRPVSRDGQGVVVVFPNEATLDNLKLKLTEYAGLGPKGLKYDELSAIEEIAEIMPEDRVGQRLRSQPLGPAEIAALDVDLLHSGIKREGYSRVKELTQLLTKDNLGITDSYVGEDLLLLRIKVDGDLLEKLLHIPDVLEVERRPEPAFEVSDVHRVGLPDLNISATVDPDLIGIVIIDSGVMQRHPLLGPVIGDAQVFPDRLRALVVGGPEDGDQHTEGHGTAVAGIAAYSDVGECIKLRTFLPSALLFSARVTDDFNQYDVDELVENQFTKAIEYFLENYPIAKVVNISLGHNRLILTDNRRYQFRLAALIDELAYKYQDRNVLFVIASGNYFPEHLSSEEMLDQYPTYLLTADNSRLIDPATAAIALTVGGLSYGAGTDFGGSTRGTYRLVAGSRNWPSPFTRIGPGINGAIKPDVVDFAGDLRFEAGQMPTKVPSYAGIPSTAKNFSPPTGDLFRTVAGTSFAAPRVANLAARLFQQFPNATSNLIRALIGDSARIPVDRPSQFARLEPWNETMLKIYGYGQPDFERARWSAKNAVLLLEEDSLEIGSFRLYSVCPGLEILDTMLTG